MRGRSGERARATLGMSPVMEGRDSQDPSGTLTRDSSAFLRSSQGNKMPKMTGSMNPSDYDNRITHLKKEYDQRISNLHQQMSHLYGSVEQDEIIKAMKEDTTSTEFIGQRIKEIVTEQLGNEREMQIERMTQEIAFLKSELKRQQDLIEMLEIEKGRTGEEAESRLADLEKHYEVETRKRLYLEEEIKHIQNQLLEKTKIYESQLRNKDSEFREITSNNQNDMFAMKKENQTLFNRLEISDKELSYLKQTREETLLDNEKYKRTFGELEEEYSAQQRMIEELKQQLNMREGDLKQLQSINFESGLRMNRLEEERKLMEEKYIMMENDKQQILDKFNAYGEQLQKSNNDSMITLRQKHKDKNTQLKKKITDQKMNMQGKDQEINHQKHLLTEIKIAYEKTITGLHEDMKKIKDEWERKCYEQDLEYQRKVAELQSKHGLQMTQVQAEFQQLLDNKLYEIQSDAQSQINKTKMDHGEMKSILDSKMAQIEKNYILANRHEEIVDEERKKMKDKFIHQMEELRDEYEKQIHQSVVNIESQKEKEIELMIKNFKNNISTLEQNMDELKSNSNILEGKLEGKEKDVERLENHNTNLNKEKRKILSELDEEKGKILDFDKAMQKEEQKRRDLEIQMRQTKENYSEIIDKLERTQNNSMKITSDQNNLKDTIEELTGKLNKETKKSRGLNDTMDNLYQSIEKLERDKNNLNQKLAQKMEEFEHEQLSLHNTTIAVKQKEAEKLDKEMECHMETKNNMLVLDTKYKQRNEEVAKLRQENIDGNIRNEELQDNIEKHTGSIYELQTTIKHLRTKLGETETQKLTIIKNNEEMRRNTLELTKNKIEKMREDILILRENVLSEVHSTKKETFAITENVLYKQRENEILMKKELESGMKMEKENIRLELLRKIDNKESEFYEQSSLLNIKFEERIREKNVELQDYEMKINELEVKNRNMNRELTEVQNRLKINLMEKKQIERDYNELNDNHGFAKEKFVSLKKEVAGQTNKMKTDFDRTLMDIREEISQNYNKELIFLKKHIQGLKSENMIEFKSILQDIAVLQLHHKQEKEAMENNFEQLSSATEFKFEKEKEKGRLYQEEIDRLEQELNLSREEQKERILQMEGQIKNLKGSLHDDTQRFHKMRFEKTEEVDVLQRRIAELANEVSLKAEIIDELSHDKESQRSELKELGLKLDMKESELHQKSTGLTKTLTKRDRKIEELEVLLAKSYHNLNTSIDNIRLTSKYEAETQDLARKVREGSRYLGVKAQKSMAPSGAQGHHGHPVHMGHSVPGGSVKGSHSTLRGSASTNPNEKSMSLSELAASSPTYQPTRHQYQHPQY